MVTDVELTPSPSEEERDGDDGKGRPSPVEVGSVRTTMARPNMTVPCRTVPMFSNENASSKADDVKSDGDGTAEDAVQELLLTAPSLRAKSDGSMTAPVVGGTGDLYLMKAAYNKMNSSGHGNKGRHGKSGQHDDGKQNK